jgi:hypothetical protein
MRATQLCGARDPEADTLVECDFLLGHDGPCSWALEREEMERECSVAELERQRRAARRSAARKAG